MFTSKILIVDDSPEMQLLVAATLRNKYHVKCVASSTEALSALKEQTYHLLILDIELPDEDGFVLLSKIRMMSQYQTTPVFFLSGRSKINDKVMGFTLGAEDYLVKPIDAVELQARVESRMRRLDRDLVKDKVFLKEPFTVDLDRQKVTVQDGLNTSVVNLTPIEFKLFVLLIRREEHILSRNQILDEVWPNTSVTDRAVDTYIYSLRKKLGVWGSCIEAVARVGYRFIDIKQKKVS